MYRKITPIPTITRRALLGLALVLSGATVWAQDDPRPVVDATKVGTEAAKRSDLPTLFIVGDSTVKSSAPLRGWGQEIGTYFDPERINVVNRAIGGRSSRTFVTEGR